MAIEEAQWGQGDQWEQEDAWGHESQRQERASRWRVSRADRSLVGLSLSDDVDLARDRLLVEQCQAGDHSAFEELYRRYRERLFRFCMRRLRDSHEAEDVTEESFIKAWKALGRFGGDRRFYPWLSVIAANLCTDQLRKRHRSIPVADIDLAGRHQVEAAIQRDDGEASVLEAEDRRIASLAFRRLNRRHQMVLELREGSSLSYQEIAEREGVEVSTVETLLWRARQALKREYQAICEGGLGAFALLGGALSSLWAIPSRAASAIREKLAAMRLSLARHMPGGSQALTSGAPAAGHSARLLLLGALAAVATAGVIVPTVILQGSNTPASGKRAIHLVSPVSSRAGGSAPTGSVTHPRSEAHLPVKASGAGTTSGSATNSARDSAASTSAPGSTVSGAGSALGSTVSGAGSALGSTVSGAGSALGNTVSGAGSALGNTVSGAGSALGSTLSGAGSALGSAASGATSALGSTASGATSALARTASGATSALGNTVSGAGSALGSTASSATSALARTASGATSALGSTVSGATGVIGDLTGVLGSGL